jgi:hypothetical protein
MSVLLVEGFETSADQPDIYKRGFFTASAQASAGIGLAAVPSRTGSAGTGLLLRGAFSTSLALPCASSATPDFGMLSLGQSVYSLWQSGGFVVGFNASFNSLNTLQIAPGYARQICYDGNTNYWAIAYNGSAYVVAYSTDLKNWTVTATQPASIGVNSTIAVVGSGATATIITTSAYTSVADPTYYSTNLGAAWTAVASVGSGYAFGATGNSTTPYIYIGYSGGWKIYPFTAISSAAGAALTSPVLVASVTYGNSMTKLVNGVVIAMGTNEATNLTIPQPGTSYFSSCLSANNPATPANWSAITSVAGQMSDIVYFNNLWITVGYGGIYTSPQLGTVGAVQGPAGPWTAAVSTGVGVISAIATNGTVAVAVGQDPTTQTLGAIWTSTNGTTWVKQNRFLLSGPAVTNGSWIPNVIWDGTRFILTVGLAYNLIATSTDGVSWSAISAPDFAEQAATTTLSFLGVYSGTQNPATGVFTPWSVAAGNTCGVGVVSGALASSARTVTASSVTAGAYLSSGTSLSMSAVGAAIGQQPPSTLSHYYELVFTAVSGTPNLFNVAWTVDNALLPVFGQYQLAATTDTLGVAQAFLNLPRNGQWTVIDDIYLTNFSGAYHNGRLGVQRIFPLLPNSDQLDQMSTTISGATNSNTVNAALSNAEGYVYSSATTAQDVYGTSNTMPGSGVVPNAVVVEGFLTALNSAAGTGTVGLQSSGVKALGGLVSTNTNPSRAVLVQETDPNTSAPWTIAAINAVDIVVAKTS